MGESRGRCLRSTASGPSRRCSSSAASSELRFTPGTGFLRTNYGWIMVSAAVEGAAGEPFTVFMRTQVFEPLGMDATIAGSSTGQVPDLATSYFPRFMAAPRYGAQRIGSQDLSCFAGGGGFLSTPSDLVRFGLAINSGKLLQPATVTLLQTPRRLPSGQETGYGLGWQVQSVMFAGRQTRWIGHDGTLSMGGNMASLITFPERAIAVAVTTKHLLRGHGAAGTPHRGSVRRVPPSVTTTMPREVSTSR